jgi:hypothetical protein
MLPLDSIRNGLVSNLDPMPTIWNGSVSYSIPRTADKPLVRRRPCSPPGIDGTQSEAPLLRAVRRFLGDHE